MNLLPKQNKITWVAFKGIADTADGKIYNISINIPLKYLMVLANETIDEYFAEMTTKQCGWKISKETYDYLLDQIKQYEHSISR